MKRSLCRAVLARRLGASSLQGRSQLTAQVTTATRNFASARDLVVGGQDVGILAMETYFPRRFVAQEQLEGNVNQKAGQGYHKRKEAS